MLEEKIAVLSAITKLISGTDEHWTESAGTVLNVAVLLDRSDEATMVVDSTGHLPAISDSAVFGPYAVLDFQNTHSVAIESLSEIAEGSRTRTEYRIYYDPDTYEPLTFVRILLRMEDLSSMKGLRWLQAYATERVESHLRRLLPNRTYRTTSYWVARATTVIYSAVPEWNPGDIVPRD